jgi:hypothetical protein
MINTFKIITIMIINKKKDKKPKTRYKQRIVVWA